ncbi:unnamed protein product [Amoebophrya sp. A25]|nr:unnamed protein product [Amoebophrya sp. A25]|eukprot:GSA25T00025860001.1
MRNKEEGCMSILNKDQKKVMKILAERLTSGKTGQQSLPDRLDDWMGEALFVGSFTDLAQEELQGILQKKKKLVGAGITNVRLWVQPPDLAEEGLLPKSAAPRQIMADVTLMPSKTTDNPSTCKRYELPAFLYYKDVKVNDESVRALPGSGQILTRQQIMVSETAGRKVGTVCTEFDVSLAVPKVAKKVLPEYLQRNYLQLPRGRVEPRVIWNPIKPKADKEFARTFSSAVEGCVMPVKAQKADIFKVTAEGSRLFFKRRVLIGTHEVGNYELEAIYSCDENGQNHVVLFDPFDQRGVRHSRPPKGQILYEASFDDPPETFASLLTYYCKPREAQPLSALELPRASVRKAATSATSSTYDYLSVVVLCGLFAAPVIATLCLLLRAALRRARPTEAEKALRVLDKKIEAEAGEEDEILYGAA